MWNNSIEKEIKTEASIYYGNYVIQCVILIDYIIAVKHYIQVFHHFISLLKEAPEQWFGHISDICCVKACSTLDIISGTTALVSMQSNMCSLVTSSKPCQWAMPALLTRTFSPSPSR